MADLKHGLRHLCLALSHQNEATVKSNAQIDSKPAPEIDEDAF